MSYSRASLFAALALLLIAAPGAAAQPADTTQLPEIAPREIEIRGEREIDLPSLERQPLTGFASPAQVPAVPAEHRPYVGSYRQTLDDLPESLPVPETVSPSMQPTAEPARGFLEGGSGRYFGRFLEGRMGTPLSQTERLSVAGEYTATEADPNDDVVDLRARLVSRQEGVRLTAQAHGTLQRYALYGATLPPNDPERESYGAGGAFGLQTTGSVPFRAEASYDNVQYTTYLGTNSNGSDVTQQQFQIQGASTLPIRTRPRLDALYRRSWFGGDIQEERAYSLDAGGALTIYRTEAITAQAGARILAYETPASLRLPIVGDASATFISPSVDVEWQIANGTRLHLQNHPRLGTTALDDLYDTNPYAEHAPALQPNLFTTDAEAGVTWSPGPVRIVTAAGYRYAPAYRFFSLDGTTGLYEVDYNSARILQGRGEIALQGIDGVQASLALSLRDGVLKAQSGDQDIPNFAPVTADAMVGISFAGGDGYLEAQTRFESRRYADMNRTDRVGSYLTLGLESSYALSSQFEIVARAENLSHDTLTQWKNYPRPPAQVEAGVRLRW